MTQLQWTVTRRLWNKGNAQYLMAKQEQQTRLQALDFNSSYAFIVPTRDDNSRMVKAKLDGVFVNVAAQRITVDYVDNS